MGTWDFPLAWSQQWVPWFCWYSGAGYCQRTTRLDALPLPCSQSHCCELMDRIWKSRKQQHTNNQHGSKITQINKWNQNSLSKLKIFIKTYMSSHFPMCCSDFWYGWHRWLARASSWWGGASQASAKKKVARTNATPTSCQWILGIAWALIGLPLPIWWCIVWEAGTASSCQTHTDC